MGVGHANRIEVGVLCLEEKLRALVEDVVLGQNVAIREREGFGAEADRLGEDVGGHRCEVLVVDDLFSCARAEIGGGFACLSCGVFEAAKSEDCAGTSGEGFQSLGGGEVGATQGGFCVVDCTLPALEMLETVGHLEHGVFGVGGVRAHREEALVAHDGGLPLLGVLEAEAAVVERGGDESGGGEFADEPVVEGDGFGALVGAKMRVGLVEEDVGADELDAGFAAVRVGDDP